MYYGVNLRVLKYGILLEFVYIIDLISFLLWLDYDYYLIVFNVWVYNLLLIVSFFKKSLYRGICSFYFCINSCMVIRINEDFFLCYI